MEKKSFSLWKCCSNKKKTLKENMQVKINKEISQVIERENYKESVVVELKKKDLNVLDYQ